MKYYLPPKLVLFFKRSLPIFLMLIELTAVSFLYLQIKAIDKLGKDYKQTNLLNFIKDFHPFPLRSTELAASPTPSLIPTDSPLPMVTPSPSPSLIPSPSPSPNSVPSLIPSPSPTQSPSPSPTPVSSLTPSPVPSPSPAESPIPSPSSPASTIPSESPLS